MFNRSYINGHKGHPHYIANSKIASLKKNVSFSSEEEDIVSVIRSLSDPTKLKIFIVLHKVDEIVVSDLAIILDLSQSAISHALADLKKLGLVKCQRCGQLTCYSLADTTKKDKFLEFFTKFL
ncbi:hypothetical protein COV58_04635 [Candidatus Roizmanbacteria bacterium CG11_big_fil_rev_8_21_14_0_20_36_8]|uniref:HTH arsR-type domain-containing protein n=2 Tax=Candidatus Roizmaniibacteriota TaxID=1752723 RepID=A0A2M6IT14_9BACT|nr:MAG: hypothetical protein COV58_04635 [Candidatus Roizmanbacteria bacterium CG11_big_fil_rev_8_21_14_0_20_36_8]PIZ64335.1 MAG: hypothetical protein COY14_04930 [Candidatus Roizmanbacteria bacterium CG_4_10_14_0_2_um_filter_36_9]